MAPDIGILKRQRSRPAEWWTVATSSPASVSRNKPGSQDTRGSGKGKSAANTKRSRLESSAANKLTGKDALKKRGRLSREIAVVEREKVISDKGPQPGSSLEADAAIPSSRGESKRRQKAHDTQKVPEDVNVLYPTTNKRQALNISSEPLVEPEEPPTSSYKRVRLSIPGDDVIVEPRSEVAKSIVATRRGRSSINTEDPQALFEGIIHPTNRKKKVKTSDLVRDSDRGTDAQAELAGNDAKPSKRRGRPSQTEAEVRAPSAKTIKSGARNEKRLERSAIVEASVELASSSSDSTAKDMKVSQAKSTENGIPSSSQRRGRSSHTEAEVAALFKQAVYGDSEADIDLGSSASHQSTAPGSLSIIKENETPDRPRRVANKEVTTLSSQDAASKRPYGRKSGTVIEIETATSRLNRSRPKKRNNISAASGSTSRVSATLKDSQSKSRKVFTRSHTDVQSNVPQIGKNKAGRPSKEAQVTEKGHEATSKARGKRHRLVEESSTLEKYGKDNNEDNSEPEDLLEYQQLTAVTRRVSRTNINSKWDPLESDCVEKVQEMVQDIQRPVISHLDERKRLHAGSALQALSRKLIRKISRGLPFPKGTHLQRGDDFDFEKILDHNAKLENVLAPTTDANRLLEANLASETALLQKETAYLRKLEKNAKTESTLRKDAARKLHTLLRQEGSLEEADIDLDSLQVGDGNRLSALDTVAHEDLQSVLMELADHVESMQNNLGQVDGIAEAITKSKAAVQATLFNHLENEQYEHVVLG